MYRERMNSYYPPVIKSILEFQAIIDAEYPEFEELEKCNEQILNDAYLLTMTEDRITQWENKLGIRPLEGSTIDNRRESVVARIRGQSKLNTEMINIIVNTFTGGKAKSRIEDSTLYVELMPFDENKISIDSAITSVTNELLVKIPAHLKVNVSIAYQQWDNVHANNSSWAVVKSIYGTWDDVKFDRQGKVNMLDSSKLNEFYLG